MKKTSLYIFFLLIIFHLNLQAQEWANSLGDPNSNTKVNAIRKYKGTDILVAGSFASQSLKLGDFTIDGSGQIDGFVAIADENGNYLWATSVGSTDVDVVQFAEADQNGNIYVAGEFKSLTLTIGDYTLYNKSHSSGFLIKYNADGTVSWARVKEGAFNQNISALAIDKEGNVYLTGTINNDNNSHIYIIKISSENEVIWDNFYNVNYNALGNKGPKFTLALDESQYLYLAGSFMDTISFGSGKIISPKVKTLSRFLAKLDTAGAFLLGIADTNFYYINSMVIHSNHLYLCGENSKLKMPEYSTELVKSYSKIYVSKYDKHLNLIWHKNPGEQKLETDLSIAQSITVDENENVYISGYFDDDTLNFANRYLINIPYNHWQYKYKNIFILKYSFSGEELWGKSFGGKFSDQGNAVLAMAEDNLVIGGEIQSDSVHFGNQVLTNAGRIDTVGHRHGQEDKTYYLRKSIGFLTKLNESLLTNVKKETDLNTSAILYPNPVNDFFVVSFRDQSDEEVSINIQTIDGKTVKKMNYKNTGSSLTVGTDEFLPGIYFVQVERKGYVFTHKFIKK